MILPDFIASIGADQHHMELWGMGPELWADRTNAWVEAGWSVLDHFVTKFGVLAIAVLTTISSIRSKKAIEGAKTELKDELGGRLDRHEKRIEENKKEIIDVAKAVPAANGIIHEDPPLIPPGF